MKKSNFRRVLSVLLATSLLFIIASCGANTSQNQNALTNEQEPGKESYKIGLHFELTGNVADYGKTELKGAKLAIKQANEEAGYEKFISEEFDNKSDTQEAVTLAAMLAGKNDIPIVVGPSTSGASAATYQVLDSAKKVVISPSATQNNITLTNPNDKASKPYEYVFRVCFEDAYQGAALAQYSIDKLAAKKAVIYQDAASDYAKGLEASFREQFEKQGGKVLSTENYVAGDTDFASVLTNLKSKDYDVLFIAGYYAEAGLIIKQARAMGIDVVILGGDGFDSTSLTELAGAENLNKVYFSTAYTTVNASDSLKTFIEAYKNEYNEEPSMFSALAYDSTNVAIKGLSEAGADSEKLKDAIKNIDFKGVTGSFKFDDKNTPVKSVLIVELVDGVQSKSEEISPK